MQNGHKCHLNFSVTNLNLKIPTNSNDLLLTIISKMFVDNFRFHNPLFIQKISRLVSDFHGVCLSCLLCLPSICGAAPSRTILLAVVVYQKFLDSMEALELQRSPRRRRLGQSTKNVWNTKTNAQNCSRRVGKSRNSCF